MKVVSTFHPTSSVVSAVKFRLASENIEHLVIAKLDRIDVYSLQPNGLQHECGVDVWGRVLCVRAIPISGTGRSKLVLMTSHPDPELVFFAYREHKNGTNELSVNKSISLYERTARPAEYFNDLLVHPSGKLAVACAYTGKLKVIKLKGADYVEDYDFSLTELNVLSLAFLPTATSGDECHIAVLFQDHKEQVRLIAREVAPDASSRPSLVFTPTAISGDIIKFPREVIPKLIPVPAQEDEDEDETEFGGGVLVVGGTKILLFELASDAEQMRQEGKRARLEKQKADPEKAKQARAKEVERDGRARKPTALVTWPYDEIAAWCAVGDLRFFVSDVCGRLSMLSIGGDGMTLVPLGQTSPPTCLQYLTNQVMFVGSHVGDSQLVHISPAPVDQDAASLSIPANITTVDRNSKGKGRAVEDEMEVDEDEEESESGSGPKKGKIVKPAGSYLKVIDSFKNIGPINDAVVVDIDGSGQNEIVTCSGGFSSGSINVIRNGAEFEEVATVLGLLNIQALWSLRRNFEDSNHSTIVASTHDQTMVFRIHDADRKTTLQYLDSTACRDLITNRPTLALSNVRKRTFVNNKFAYKDSNWVVQVVGSGVSLLEEDIVLGGFNERAKWAGRREIVTASINPSQILVALHGGELVVLRFNEAGTMFEEVLSKYTGFEISAISCAPPDTTAPYTTLISVGYWNSAAAPPSEDPGEARTKVTQMAIEIFKLERNGLVSFAKVSKDILPALPRSILLHDFEGNLQDKSETTSHLLCGLSDGTVAHWHWRQGELRDMKTVSLGHSPVHLTACEVDGKKCVFAAGSRATVFSYARKRFIHSPVMLKDLTAACTLRSPSFQGAFALANQNGITIGSVKELGKINIRTTPMGYDAPQRIVHVPLFRAFAVVCVTYRPTRVNAPQDLSFSLKIMDETTFEVLSQFSDINEEITAVETFTHDAAGKQTALLCVGLTSPTTKKARLALFSPTDLGGGAIGRDLSHISSVNVNGEQVYALKIVAGFVVAAIDSAVVTFKINANPHSVALEQVEEWQHNYLCQSLGTFGKRVAVGDAMSSVSLIELDGDSGKITAVARDFASTHPYSLEALSEGQVVGGNDDSNLFIFSVSKSQSTGRNVLDRIGSYFLGDLATRFVRGSISSDITSRAVFDPEAIFFTSCGKIGSIIDVKDGDVAIQLFNLQRNLSAYLEGKGVGAPSHAKFRAPPNKKGRTDAEDEAVGFLDGDFLESFLLMGQDTTALNGVLMGKSQPEQLALSAGEYQKLLEDLQTMH